MKKLTKSAVNHAIREGMRGLMTGTDMMDYVLSTKSLPLSTATGVMPAVILKQLQGVFRVVQTVKNVLFLIKFGSR